MIQKVESINLKTVKFIKIKNSKLFYNKDRKIEFK